MTYGKQYKSSHGVPDASGTAPQDTVAVQELRFGDNDTLSAQVATLVEADYLFLLTDVDALYTSNPKIDPTATPIHEVEDIRRLSADTSSTGTQWGTGGMVTKLTAARIATAAGCCMVICSSDHPESILAILAGEKIGTKFHPLQKALKGRKRWILSVPVRGAIWMDAGAVRAVCIKHTSLFSAGVVKVIGDFCAQDAVSLCDEAGLEFGRGLCNFGYEHHLLYGVILCHHTSWHYDLFVTNHDAVNSCSYDLGSVICNAQIR
eukprot:jgi/Chrzof1/9144/Cz03g37160.t1